MNKGIRKLTITAILISLSFIFSKFDIVPLPFGGGIQLFPMLILSIPGYLFGPYFGFMGTAAFSLLKISMASYFVNIAQVLLDYFFAYIGFGITGFVKNKELKSFIGMYLLACFLRFVFTALSGYIFWKEYCPTGWNIIVYTIVYNASYIFIEAMFSTIILFTKPIKNILEKLKNG